MQISRIAMLSLLPVLTLCGELGDPIEGKIGFKLFESLKFINNDPIGSMATDQQWLNDLLQSLDADSLIWSFTSDDDILETIYTVYFPSTKTNEYALNSFRVHQEVEDAWMDKQGEFFTGVDTNDPLSDEQWPLANISVEGAWTIESGSSNIIVGVVDSGIDLGVPTAAPDPHPDIAPNLWNENGLFGYNFLNPDDEPWEIEGSHGTKMTGLIGAITNNNEGIAGVAGGGFNGDSGITILSVKVGVYGPQNSELLGRGIEFAVNNGAKVINISGGFYDFHYCEDDDPDDYFRDFPYLSYSISYAMENDVVVVTAAGNNGWDVSNCCPSCDEFRAAYPAAYASLGQNIIVVTSVDEGDIKVSNGNYGNFISVSAPGAWMRTISPRHQSPYSGYGHTNATSAACALTSGIAALICSVAPQISNDMVKDVIVSTADNIDALNPTYIGQLGSGRINAQAALELIQSSPERPTGMDIDVYNNHPHITWNANEEADLVEYKIRITYENRIGSNPRFWTYTYETQYTTETEYTDNGLTLSWNGTVYAKYKVAAMDVIDNISLYSSQVSMGPGGLNKPSIPVDQPTEYILSGAYPNPFNPSTTIRYGLPEDSNVSLVIYDVRGLVIQTLTSGTQPAGWYDVILNGETADGNTISTGIYFARLVAGEHSQVIKMLSLK